MEPTQGKVDLQKEVGVCVRSERQLQNAVKNGGLGLKHVEKSEMTSKNPVAARQREDGREEGKVGVSLGSED